MSQYKKAKLLVKQTSTRSSEPCGATIESDSDAEQTVERYQSFVAEWQRSFADRPTLPSLTTALVMIRTAGEAEECGVSASTRRCHVD